LSKEGRRRKRYEILNTTLTPLNAWIRINVPEWTKGWLLQARADQTIEFSLLPGRRRQFTLKAGQVHGELGNPGFIWARATQVSSTVAETLFWDDEDAALAGLTALILSQSRGPVTRPQTLNPGNIWTDWAGSAGLTAPNNQSAGFVKAMLMALDTGVPTTFRALRAVPASGSTYALGVSDIGGKNIVFSRSTNVGVTETSVIGVAEFNLPNIVYLRNDGAVACDLGPTGVTVGTGYTLSPGAELPAPLQNVTGQLFGIVAAGTTDIDVLAVYGI